MAAQTGSGPEKAVHIPIPEAHIVVLEKVMSLLYFEKTSSPAVFWLVQPWVI